MTSRNQPIRFPDAPWLRRYAVRTPTLPPATHTNVYAIGVTRRVAVIDPASPWSEEQAALDAWIEAEGIEVEAILLTHHHVDHVSGAAHLARRTGARIAAHAATAELLAGRVEVSEIVEEGQVLPFGPAGIEALHTPGHAAGHLVFRCRASETIIAGDLVASEGTILIDPDEGDMAQYLASLARVRALSPRRLLPAHGEPVDEADALLAFYIRHRLEREQRVYEALLAGAARIEGLLPRAYADVPVHLWPLAARSLLSHLKKLGRDGRAVDRDGEWAVA